MKLSRKNIGSVSDFISLPDYAPESLEPGILHLGVGAFHRAHQCLYYDELARAGETNCGVFGVSFNSSHLQRTLKVQDNLYIHSRVGNEISHRVIGCILGIASLKTGVQMAMDLFEKPNLKLVTLTVTEKAYVEESPVIDFLIEGLRRRKNHDYPLVICSCDNLLNNSARLGYLIKQKLEADIDFSEWVNDRVSFPSSVVDSITPRTSSLDYGKICKDPGVEDDVPVVCENYRSWIIESVPLEIDLAKVGVTYVSSIEPYQQLKLRILNGAHSLIAYGGMLLGYKTVYEVMQDNMFKALVKKFMGGMLSTIADLPDVSGTEYIKNTLERFNNPMIEHGLRQIGEDGFSKLSQRVKPVLEKTAGVKEKKILSVPLVLWGIYEWRKVHEKTGLSPSEHVNEDFRQKISETGSESGLEDIIVDLFFVEEVREDISSSLHLFERLGARGFLETLLAV